jgi:hypothetical protein
LLQRFFSSFFLFSVFPSSAKLNISKFQFDQGHLFLIDLSIYLLQVYCIDPQKNFHGKDILRWMRPLEIYIASASSMYNFWLSHCIGSTEILSTT